MHNLKTLQEQTKSISILYSEDNDETRNQFYELFSILFDNIDIAVDGKEALEKYKNKEYDLIITDINMPNMNGLDLIRAIHDINKLQKVIIVSAHNSSEYLLEAIALNIDGFILKPVNMNQLENTLLKTVRLIHAEKLFSAYHQELEKNVEIQTAKLTKQLITDDLTGLLNRRALDIRLKSKKQNTFILINIDNFDSINITYDYYNGDVILKEIAKFLRDTVPKEYNVYHLGADEYAILLNGNSIPKAKELAQNIKHSLLEHTIIISDFRIKLTVTISIARGTKELHRNAHIALKDIKNKGKNQIAIYDKNLPTELLQMQIQQLTPIIKEAIAKRYITPYYQPIINNKTGKIEKFESLARIVDDKNNIYQPHSFIKIAELTGMIPEITQIMIDKTFKAFKDNDYHFSINISEYDLNDGYLIEYFTKKLKEYKIPPSRVVIEVLEGVSANGVKNNIEQLNSLKKLGFSIAIDDFGAENSNFQRVHNMNVDFIKIDGSFVKNINTNEKSYNISKTITYFANSIGAKVIAEFVHSKSVLDKVNELGIEYTQGYYFAEPKPYIINEL